MHVTFKRLKQGKDRYVSKSKAGAEAPSWAHTRGSPGVPELGLDPQAHGNRPRGPPPLGLQGAPENNLA